MKQSEDHIFKLMCIKRRVRKSEYTAGGVQTTGLPMKRWLLCTDAAVAAGLGLLILMGMAWPVSAAADGAALYLRQCAACHGNNGLGSVGVPLALPDFLAVADDHYLRTTIRRGRPGRVMPAFTQLQDEEISALVRHIRGWQPPAAKSQAPIKALPGSTGRGERLYVQNCAVCHGDKGQGGHGTGVTFSRPRDYPILAPALNNPGFLAAASDDMIKTTLARGRAGTPMVSFREKGLSDKNLDDIVAYVRSFQKKPSPTAVPVDEPAVISRVSSYSVEETVSKLQTAFNAANMRVVRTQPYDKGYAPEGRENTRRMVVDACDFDLINEALKLDPRVGLFLPCRVIVSEHDGEVRVMSVNPKRLSVFFNNAELNEMCAHMSKAYIEVIEEALF